MSPLLILDLVVKSLVIILLASAAQACWRRASAGQRCLVWLAAFAGLLILPLTLFIQPYWAPVVAAPAASRVSPASQVIVRSLVAGMPQALAVPLKPEMQAVLSPLQVAGLLWLAGWGCVLGHRALGSWRLLGLRAQSVACEDARLVQRVADLAQSLGIRRSVEVLTATAMAVPVTWGVWRPVVLLPREALAWNDEVLHAALVHELGHVRHWDAASRWLATFVCALQWWNPLAWAAARSWRKAQEQAADDCVLRSGASAEDYAMLLLKAARSFQEGLFPMAPVLAMARPSTLETRLSAIMDAGRDRRRMDAKNVSAAVFTALLVMGGLSSLSLQGQPAKAQAATEAAKPQAATTQQVATVVKVLKAPAGHFAGNPQIRSGKILSPQEAETLLKDPGVKLESTPSVVTWDHQKVSIEDQSLGEENLSVGKKITLVPAIAGEKVTLAVDFFISEPAGEDGRLPAVSSRTLKASVEVPAGRSALLVLPPVEKQADIVLLITPTIVAGPPPFVSAEERASKIILPRVQWSEVTVDEALDALRVMVREVDAEHRGLNLLKVGHPGGRVSLDVKEASLQEVLSSVARLADLELQYDPEVVVLSPRGFALQAAGLQPSSETALAAAKAYSIALPPMNFHETVFEDVVGYLRREVGRANPAQARFNIILDDPSPAAKQLITFDLQDLSMMDFLHYLALLGDYTLTADKASLMLAPAAR